MIQQGRSSAYEIGLKLIDENETDEKKKHFIYLQE